MEFATSCRRLANVGDLRNLHYDSGANLQSPESAIGSGVGGFEGSGGVRAISSSSAVWPHPPPPTPLHEKISSDVSHGPHWPHWTVQGGPDPRTPLASYATGHRPCTAVALYNHERANGCNLVINENPINMHLTSIYIVVHSIGVRCSHHHNLLSLLYSIHHKKCTGFV